MSIAQARREPVAMMESGPVAGMIGAGRLASLLGIERAIGFDMGGTTAKTTLITSGVAPIEEGYVIGDPFTGQPMQLPVVDIVEVGAGGGSLAWCDGGGGLHVGPVSAGADPGPACYGRGGEAPAVTDADLVLGRLNGERFLDGRMRLDRAFALAAVGRIARTLGLDPVATALGITTIADGAMSLAVRAVSVNRGIDPRDTTLIAFGGAGPLHAVAVAREISIPRVVIPKLPGNFSALGMLMAQWRQDFVRTLIGALGEIKPADAARAFAELVEKRNAGRVSTTGRPRRAVIFLYVLAGWVGLSVVAYVFVLPLLTVSSRADRYADVSGREQAASGSVRVPSPTFSRSVAARYCSRRNLTFCAARLRTT
jgi:N-methylhydantoinase A